MRAGQMQILGIVLIAVGLVILGVTQFVLIRSYEKKLREM